jgi:hypothetical protein
MMAVCYGVLTCIISPFGCQGVLMMFIGGVLVYGLDVGSGLSAGGRVGSDMESAKAVAVLDQPRRRRPNDVCHRVVAAPEQVDIRPSTSRLVSRLEMGWLRHEKRYVPY